MFAAWNEVSKVMAWKFVPESNQKSHEIETLDRELIDVLKETFEVAPKSEYFCFEADFESPRYFVRLFSNEGLMVAGEVLKNYTLLGEDLMYTPHSKLWGVLERIVID